MHHRGLLPSWTRRRTGARLRPGAARPLVLVALLAASLGLLLVGSPPAAAAAPSSPASTDTPVSTPPEPMTPHPRVYAGGGVIPFGRAQQLNSPPPGPLNSVMVAMAANPAAGGSQGYWVAGADGGVFTYGNAGFYGSAGWETLNGPIVGMAATPDGRGYWLVALDGGIFTFGDAGFYGSMGGQPLNQPVVGMAATPDGRGYWLVAADGGIFSFGDAGFHGSMGGQPLNAPVVAMAATANGGGYWMVASDGGIFTFGNAPFYGSMGSTPLNASMVGMAVAPDGRGYLLAGFDGGIFGFGSAPFYGSLGSGYGGDPSDMPPVTGITYSPDGQGYWLFEPDGWSYGFNNPPSPAATPTTSAIVGIANSQVRSDPNSGYFCNPYGPCEEWCALFVTWVWQQAGVPIPSYDFTGDIYDWAAGHTGVVPPWVGGLPGDAVLYGTGPQSPDTSFHVGLVVQRWPDGAIVTIDGDSGPAPTGSLAVVVNGPFLPSPSNGYGGIYAFAHP
jgi:hypothetical protein